MPTIHPRLPGGDKSNSRQGLKVKRAITHWWGDPRTSTVEATIGTLTDPNRTASVHYIIDGDDIYPQVTLDRRAWTSGSFEADGPAITFELNPRVSDATFNSYTWLLAKLIRDGDLPRDFEISGHKDWAATACCGDWYPLLGKIKSTALALVDTAEQTVAAPKPKLYAPRILAVDGQGGVMTTRRLAAATSTRIGDAITGQLAGDMEHWPALLTLTEGGPQDDTAAAVQKVLADAGYYTGAIDGLLGERSAYALQDALAAEHLYDGDRDGYVGPLTMKGLQRKLNDQFNLVFRKKG